MKNWITLAVGVVVFLAVACGQQSEEASPIPTSDSTPSGIIQGRVTDSEGNSLAGMRVGIVSGTAAFPEIGSETNNEGEYALNSVPPGTFEVGVHDRQGTRVALESVVVRSAETSTLDFSISTSGEATLNFETCEGFLDEPTPGLVLNTRNFTDEAKKDNPNLVSFCQASYESADGSSSINLTVLKFDSVGAAEAHYETLLNGLKQTPGNQVTEGVVGPRSFKVAVNAGGVGSFAGFQDGVHAIQLHTAMPEGETPLADVDELVSMAQVVKERLP